MLLLLLIFLASVVGFIPGTIVLVIYAFHRAADGAYRQTIAIVLLGSLVAGSPWIIWTGLTLYATEQAKEKRVPAPLQVAQTEYALEQSWGIGLPGDNETGFVVYRLTDESAKWLNRHGSTVRSIGDRPWLETPIHITADSGRTSDPWRDDASGGRRTHHAIALARRYLEQYGFSIPVDAARLRDADAILNSPGSFYRYGAGGSVTIINPRHARVYFLYAG